MNISADIKYIGVNDHQIDLFEGQYDVPNGMAYNSYVIMDEKIAVMDSMEQHFTAEWLANLEAALQGRQPDYLVVQHMEPDHSASVDDFMKRYPNATVAASRQAFAMMKNFFGTDYPERQLLVGEGSTLALGKHTLTFVAAPMVHWPEVVVTYDACDKVLFSADGFGKFGANDVEDPEGWDCEARRYYFGIVGKFGPQVQALLKKAANLDIATICPLHGPVLTGDLSHYLAQYNTWSSYGVESDGVVIAYTSVYGHTKAAVEKLAALLKGKGVPKVSLFDLARDDMAEAVEDAFRYGKIVLATTTDCGNIFPVRRTFVEHLAERGYQNRTVGLIENGSWAPTSAKLMAAMFEKSKDIRICNARVTIKSALAAANDAQLEALAAELAQ